MRQSIVGGYPVVEAVGAQVDPAAAYFARVALRTTAELESDANAAIVMCAQEALRPQFISEILEPAQAVYSSFAGVLQDKPAHMQFTDNGPSVFWVFQRRRGLAAGGEHVVQTCVEVAAPYAALSQDVIGDLPAAQRLVTAGEQPDHDILGVHRKSRLGLGKLFGFKPYEQGMLAAILADQLLVADSSQISIYTAVDHGEGLQPQALGRFRFNHAQHMARKMQFLDLRNSGLLAQSILEADHELSAAGAETYLRGHIGWSMPSDYQHIAKVEQIIAESALVADNSQCVAPIFAYAAYSTAA